MINIGYAITGSFCTFRKTIEQMKKLKNEGYNIIPVMSFNAFSIDTRFGKAKDFREEIEDICGNKIIATIDEAEPIGPKKLCDVVIVSPCTGNTLSKLSNGIYDTPVTLAVKSHLRNERPVLLGVSTNDALRNSAKNIGSLMNYKHIYFIPLCQDDFEGKPYSIVCDFEKTSEAVKCALEGRQLQPFIK